MEKSADDLEFDRSATSLKEQKERERGRGVEKVKPLSTQGLTCCQFDKSARQVTSIIDQKQCHTSVHMSFRGKIVLCKKFIK